MTNFRPRCQRGARLAMVLAAGVVVILPAVTTPASASPGGSSAESTADWVQVDAGDNHTCGVRTSGRLYCWGFDTFGQLGNGPTDTDQGTPVEVDGAATDWAKVAAGYSHTCAIKTNGRLYCWGYDAFGQLGDGGTNASQTTPVEVAGGHTDWTAVTLGEDHTCGRRRTGRLYCWGYDAFGQLGDGVLIADHGAPVQVVGGFTSWASVSAGRNHTCARRTSGRLFCWGLDSSGQLGDGGTNDDQAAPVQVAEHLTTWTSVSAGYGHTCGRRTSGRLFCWGDDDAGQLGNGGTNSDRGRPVRVAGGFTDWTAPVTGTFHTCARRSNGHLYCWGNDFSGQVGDGGANLDQGTPVEVFGALSTWSSVTGGEQHTCGRRSSGRLFCWGRDNHGQVGNGGANVDQAIPAQVA